jgi:hypothetical protein
MTRKDEQEPLRGDAAWAAQRQRVADNNEAAYKRGREQRATQDAAVSARRRADDERDRRSLPEQPTP